jgi:hypothetical protein
LVRVGFPSWSYHRNRSRLGERNYEFDAGGKQGAFEPHAKRYQDLAKLVLTLAAASAAFLLSFLVNIGVSKPPNGYSVRFEAAAPFAMVFLCVSAGSCLTFMLLQNIYYEHYTHVMYPIEEGVPKKSPYSGKKYAFVLMFECSPRLACFPLSSPTSSSVCRCYSDDYASGHNLLPRALQNSAS